jgi:hypothetical protein
MAAVTPLETRSTGGGKATTGDLAGRAVLVVPLDGTWELHDKPWDESHEGECEDSYWRPEAETIAEWSAWGIEWVEPSELIPFVRTHWPEFDAESIAAKRLPTTHEQAGESPPPSLRRTLLIRICLIIVILGLFVSGVTAFPLREELTVGRDILGNTGLSTTFPDLAFWVQRVAEGLDVTGTDYPFLAYGTDWLAFAHLAIAVAFVGPLIDPVRNVWVTIWGLIMCAGIVPLALIAGAIRGLPLGWQRIDISFGVVAAVPLTIALVLTRRLARAKAAAR